MSETIDLRLTAMAHGGSALGRYEGQVIFVPYAIPGEVVRVQLTESHKRWAKAKLLEVLEPSPQRVKPPCPFFGPNLCGGCHFQHIGYEAQVEWKREVVVDQLTRLGGVQGADGIVLDAIGAAEPWGYRNHAQLSVDAQGRLGYLTADTHRVVSVDGCLILDPLLDELWAALDMEWPQLHRLSLRCGSATGDRMAVFELNHYEDFDIHVDFAVSCIILLADGEAVVLMGDSVLTESVAGRDFQVSAGSFFQVNTAGAQALISLVREYLDPQGHETLVDLYCGVGLFGLLVADSVGRVIGVESSASAVADFWRNAQGQDNVELFEAKAKDGLARIQEPVDLLVLDPPRSGAGAPTIAEIARLAPSRIVYVSCDPATLARDSRRLAEQGYGLRLVQPLDLFPQTFHIESVAVFDRYRSART